MNLCCVRYKLYDRFKQTKVASLLFYYGRRFQHFGQVIIVGTLVSCVHKNTDGDMSLDLEDTRGMCWHLELTVCQDAELHEKFAGFKRGDRVRVAGTHTFDPDHHIGPKKFTGGKHEIHPVIAIEAV